MNTTPAAERPPLTDERIAELWNFSTGGSIVPPDMEAFARAVWAAGPAAATSEADLSLAPACSPCAEEPGARCCGTGECWTCPLNTKRGSLLEIWREECERAPARFIAPTKSLCFDEAALTRIGGALESAALDAFQARVDPWMVKCFGAEVSRDRTERSHRFIEEALELVQAAGCTASEAHQLVDYVFGRPVGELSQEVGGVMVTLAALCLAQDVDMHAAGETELARVWTKIDVIRAKHAAKPKHSPLPGPTSSVDEIAERAAFVAEANRRGWRHGDFMLGAYAGWLAARISAPASVAQPRALGCTAAWPPLSLMQQAFRTTETEGDPDPAKRRYSMVFGFPSLAALRAADDEWLTLSSSQRMPLTGAEAAPERCPHGVRNPHPCRECEDATPIRLLSPQPAPARDVVPGKVHCSKCGFTLQRVNLYMLSGTTGPGGEETEPCPNDGTPMLPVTWEQEAREAWKMGEQQFDRAHALEAAAAELVACKDLKDEESRQRQRRNVALSRDRQATARVDAMRDEYNRRKPLAWAAMRALLPKVADHG